MKSEAITPDQEICPCEHMTNLVSRRSDNTLGGPAKWYTDFHVATCPKCKKALEGLRQVNAQLKEMSSVDADLKLDEKDWKSIEAGWDEEEKGLKKGS
jgi:hypothetical protein